MVLGIPIAYRFGNTIAAAVTLILFLAIGWNYLVSPAERSRLVTWLRVRRPIAAPEIRG